MADGRLKAEFDAIVSAAHRVLKPRGYLKKGARFRRGLEGNYVIVQFQKSAWSSAEDLSLTVNFGILSSRLARESGGHADKVFDEAQAVARARIGQFQSRPADLWWSLDGTGKSPAVIAELLPLLERGVDFCESHASDDALASLWLRAKDPDSSGPEPGFLLNRTLETLVAG